MQCSRPNLGQPGLNVDEVHVLVLEHFEGLGQASHPVVEREDDGGREDSRDTAEMVDPALAQRGKLPLLLAILNHKKSLLV